MRLIQQCSCGWERSSGENLLLRLLHLAVSIFLGMTHPCSMSRQTDGSKQAHAVIDCMSCSGSYTPSIDFRRVSKGQWSHRLTKVDHCTLLDVSALRWSRRLAIGVSLGRHILGGFALQETDALDMATTGLCSSCPGCPLAPTCPFPQFVESEMQLA